MILAFALAVTLVVIGAVAGGLAIVVIGIHREEKAYSLTGKSPGWTASGARAINGVYVRSPVAPQQASHHQQASYHQQDDLASANQETKRYKSDPRQRPYGMIRAAVAPGGTDQMA
jgi:hypothetical protein